MKQLKIKILGYRFFDCISPDNLAKLKDLSISVFEAPGQLTTHLYKSWVYRQSEVKFMGSKPGGKKMFFLEQLLTVTRTPESTVLFDFPTRIKLGFIEISPLKWPL